jgi:exopolysaccharide biosynthesis WecB/TagA/CpsF family protein
LDSNATERLALMSGSPRVLSMRPPALFFGVPVDDLTMAETLDLIDSLVHNGRRRGTTHQIATVNVDFLVNALVDPEVKSILQLADVCIPDGMPLVWGAGPLGMSVRERVAGSDLLPLLIDASRTRGWHVHVFGSTPEVAEQAHTLLSERYPGARFSIDPGPMLSDVRHIDEAVLQKIVDVQADVLCVALGNPKQELFIRAHRQRLGTPVMIGIGGSLDMLVGKRRRAPVLIQRVGLEWVVRAVQEPRRLVARYAKDVRIFAPSYARQWRSNRRRRDSSWLELNITDAGVMAQLRKGIGSQGGECWARAANAVLLGAPLVVNAALVSTVRDVDLASAFGLIRVARRSNVPVRWTGADGDLVARFAEIGLSAQLLGLTQRP